MKPVSGSPWSYFALTIVSAALLGMGWDLEVGTLAIPAFLAVLGFGSVAAIKALTDWIA